MTNRENRKSILSDTWLKWICLLVTIANLAFIWSVSIKGWPTIIILALTPAVHVLAFTGHVLVQRRIQFRLSTLLFVASSIAVPLATFAYDIREAKTQEVYLATIRENNGSWFRYDVSPIDRRKGANGLQLWLLNTLGDDFFASVEWLDIAATDGGFNGLSDIKHLYGVNLRACKIIDNDLKFCQSQPFLRHICLDDTPITDEGIRYILQLNRLEEVWLRNTRITQRSTIRLKHRFPDCRIHTNSL